MIDYYYSTAIENSSEGSRNFIAMHRETDDGIENCMIDAKKMAVVTVNKNVLK